MLGKPADLQDTQNPDWIPTLNMSCQKSRTVVSQMRKSKRRKRKVNFRYYRYISVSINFYIFISRPYTLKMIPWKWT